ncbi:e3 ubiquitin-protein ligase UHRF1 [Caerostris extrusa]|uniref:E3 ubiquitin-protein ligase UHRF1 n=1 Tax=Caerostris extrusa TaxID=172846 RepID=A0AAV4MXH2_CAEEX|nr:e3 ubiquitin-protein ligase UHRF1 [Caerostris extrusa]
MFTSKDGILPKGWKIKILPANFARFCFLPSSVYNQINTAVLVHVDHIWIIFILHLHKPFKFQQCGSGKQLEDAVSKKVNKENKGEPLKNVISENHSDSKFFKIGNLVDAIDLIYGAWFEAKIIDIKAASTKDKHVLKQANEQVAKEKAPISDEEGLIYKVVYEDYEDCEEPADLSFHQIRPRARKGFWYDCCVTKLKKDRSTKEFIGTIFVGIGDRKQENCKIIFLDEIFAIEKTVALMDAKSGSGNSPIVPRGKMTNCTHCKDMPNRKCKVCGCHICGEDDWYCPDCKNDETEVVRAGEKLKASKKKARMASANSSTTRDWGKGMACAGRTKECTIVPPNHFGPIPGVEVGTMWKFRVQVSESGVHRLLMLLAFMVVKVTGLIPLYYLVDMRMIWY